MRIEDTRSIRTGVTCCFMVFIFVSLFGLGLSNNMTVKTGNEQEFVTQVPANNGVSINEYIETFDNWANGVPISGRVTGQAVTWVVGSTGGTFQGSSTVISTGNSGCINDSGSGPYIWAAAEFDSVSPQTPDASNQYWAALDVKITSGIVAQIFLSQVYDYPGIDGQMCVCFEANGSLTVCVPNPVRFVGTGLTWEMNTTYTLVMQCISANMSRFSLDGGNTWSQAFDNIGNWTSPAVELCIYTGNSPACTAYFDNLATSWAQSVLPNASFTVNANPVQMGRPLVTTHTGSNGTEPCTYQWNFDDESNSTNCTTENAVHVYSVPGTYTVTLWMQDSLGHTSKQAATVTVAYISETFESYADGSALPGQGNWVVNPSPNMWGQAKVRHLSGPGNNVGECDDPVNGVPGCVASWWNLPGTCPASGWNWFMDSMWSGSTSGPRITTAMRDAAATGYCWQLQFFENGTFRFNNIANFNYQASTWYLFKVYFNTALHKCWYQYSTNNGVTWTTYNNSNNGYSYLNNVTPGLIDFNTANYVTGTGRFDNLTCSWMQPTFDLLLPGINTKRIGNFWYSIQAFNKTWIQLSTLNAVTIISTIPNSLVPADISMYNFTAIDASVLGICIGRVYYDNAAMANQVNENDLQVIAWNPTTGSWTSLSSRLVKSGNFVEFSITPGLVYLLVSTPKRNYDIIVIIIIVASVGVAAVVSYQVRIKRSKVKTTPKSKKSISSYSQVPGEKIDPAMAASNKRARLMQTSQTITSETESVHNMAKKSTNSEPDVDIAARETNARDMESQVNVVPVMTKCVVHKGPITGFSYTCKHCGVPYCMECYKHLIASKESCWNCHETLNDPSTSSELVKKKVTILASEIWKRLEMINLSEDIMDEVIAQLKTIPPKDRMQYLDERFEEIKENDDW